MWRCENASLQVSMLNSWTGMKWIVIAFKDEEESQADVLDFEGNTERWKLGDMPL